MKGSSSSLPVVGCCSSYIRLKVGEIKKDPEAAKIFALRTSLLAFLVIAAVTFASLTYNKLKKSDERLFESRFDSFAQSGLNSVVDSFSRMNLGIQELSSTFSYLYPDAEAWPYVAWDGFHPTAKLLGKVSSVEGMAILPIVLDHQISKFEQFTAEYYSHDPEKDTYAISFFPNTTIWIADFTSLDGPPIPVTTGNTDLSEYKLVTPLSQYTLSSLAGPNNLNYDVHSDPLYVGAIDSVIDCASTHNHTFAATSCGAISLVRSLPYPNVEIPDPVITDMVGVFIHPIFPARNTSQLVGFAAGTMSWKALLEKVVPEYVNELDCVIEADTGAFTFTIRNGIPTFKGIGDLHNHKYTSYRQSRALVNPHIIVSSSATFELSFYPTKTFHDDYVTFGPIRACIALVCTFSFCYMLFYCYDILMHREFSRRQAVLDTKRRFVRFISHEIRTPLNTVRLGLKLFDHELCKISAKLSRSPLSDATSFMQSALVSWKNLTDEILESTESAVEVLDDLLNYDKIEVGALRLEFSCFSMRELAERTTSMMQVQAQQKEINLTLHCEVPRCSMGQVVSFANPPERDRDLAPVEDVLNEDCLVVGDVSRMGQVLRNLVSNALKFTPPNGNVSIRVELVPRFESIPEKVRLSSSLYQTMVVTGGVRIAVKDSGAGLTPQQLAEICNEGVQFNANELQAGQGSGLGLFISKGIVEQHGGTLSVASDGLGKGVTFTVELPRFRYDYGNRSFRSSMRSMISKAPSVQDSNHSLPTDDLPPTLPSSKVNAGGIRLLVVDDSHFNRKMLMRLLTFKDYDCEQAQDGAQALKVYAAMCARGDHVDAVLMDFEMPVMNGPTATKKLREMGCTALIVGVTGNVLPDEVALFKQQGADAVLPKPLVLEDLEALLHSRSFDPSSTPQPFSLFSVKDAPVVRYPSSGKVCPIENV